MAAFYVSPPPTLAQPSGLTSDEVKCETGADKTLAKFWKSKGQCVQKCLSAARRTSGPYAGCFAPYTDPTIVTCIQDPLKGAEAKARAKIAKGCTKDCPECYDPQTCSNGEPFVSPTEGQEDVFTTFVYCVENGGGTPPSDQAKCEDGVAKNLQKFIGSKTKCYNKCFQNAFKGTVPEGSCTPPATDPPTVACITTAETKSAAAIDKVCAAVGANPPCTFFTTGASWVGVTEGAWDAIQPTVLCGSPSGAFLD